MPLAAIFISLAAISCRRAYAFTPLTLFAMMIAATIAFRHADATLVFGFGFHSIAFSFRFRHYADSLSFSSFIRYAISFHYCSLFSAAIDAMPFAMPAAMRCLICARIVCLF